MGRPLAQTAETLSCSERTLRRYINAGLLRGRRLDRHQYELPEQEERYAREHWKLLHALRAAVRTERDLRLAVLFGSTATGEDDERSDVDLLIGHRNDDPRALAALRRRLSDALGRRVHVIRIEAASQSPNLLADALIEGRVIVDRDGLWPELQANRADILVQAADEDAVTLARAHTFADAVAQRSER